MEEETGATQGAPEGSAAPTPAIEQAPSSGSEQTPQNDSQQTPPSGEGQEASGKPKQTPWFQRRIDQLTAEKWDERRARERAEAALAAALGGQQTPTTEGQQAGNPPAEKPPVSAKPLSQADIDRLAEQKATQIASQRAFNEACNKAYDAGKAEFNDFDTALSNLGMLGAVGPQANPAFLEAATALPDAHRILHHLGNNPDDAARIVGLPSVQMAAELGRLSASIGRQSRQVSNAPAPIKPVDGSARGEPDPDNMSMTEWLAWREKTARKR